MIDWAIGHVPVKLRSEAFIWLLVGFAFVAGFAANFERRATVITQTRMTHPSVLQILGKPAQTVDGGTQVNPQLAGLGCDVYVAGRAISKLYCHR